MTNQISNDKWQNTNKQQITKSQITKIHKISVVNFEESYERFF